MSKIVVQGSCPLDISQSGAFIATAEKEREESKTRLLSRVQPRLAKFILQS